MRSVSQQDGDRSIRDSGFSSRELQVLGGALLAVVLWGFGGFDRESPSHGRQSERMRPTIASVPFSARADEVLRGQTVFEANGCGACHSTDGSAGLGPTLQGAWGATRSMADGTEIVMDEAYFRQSILLPQARRVADFDEVAMPSYEGLVSEDDLVALATYVESLQ